MDRAADRATQHHTGDLADHDQRQDQEQRGEQLGSRRGDMRDEVRSQQHARDRAEQHADERQQRAERTRTPAGDRGYESHCQHRDVQPL